MIKSRSGIYLKSLKGDLK